MNGNLKCRWELGQFRWKRVSWAYKAIAIFSFLSLLIMLCIPYPEDNDALLVTVLILAFFFITLLFLTMGIIFRCIRKVNQEHREQLNLVRRKYGVKER